MKFRKKGNLPLTAKVQIGELKFSVLNNPNDIGWYSQRPAFEERSSKLYTLIAQHGFKNFVDIGANVGYISMLAGMANPEMKIVSIEADPRLIPLISENLASIVKNDFLVLHALLGLTDNTDVFFSLNPSSTLDNRVSIKEWEQIKVPMRSMQSIAAEIDLSAETFFKVDTQGYEFQVISGMHDFLDASESWRMKAEFAPFWLRSQGTDPIELLSYLIRNFQVAEAPERIKFNAVSLDDLWSTALTLDQATDFIAWVENLNRNKRGWVDLLIRPKP
jgi:FkbM family methyltransferase